MARTALDLITSSLRLINVMASGETVPIDMANESLTVLNDMIDAWNAQRQAIFTLPAQDFPLVLNQQSYTMGPGGNFNVPRPARIEGMSSILLYNPTNPVEVPITMFTVQDWQLKVPVKAVSGTFPLICYDDGGFPLRTLNFWPIPSQGPTNNVRIYSWQAIAAQTLNTTVAFPPAYAKGIRYNLAIDLAGEFNAPIPPEVADQAAKTLAVIKAMNAPSLEIESDLLPAPGGYNYRADLFGMGW